jgi:hypothetical protein
MAHLVAVDPQVHKECYVYPERAEFAGAELQLIPVVPSEVAHVACQMPVLLTKNEQTGQFVLAAMTGFEPKQNLFWQDGRWQGLYLPLQLQRQPFFLGKNEDTGTDYAVCLDMQNPAVGQGAQVPSGAQALFSNTGADTEYYRNAKQILASILHGEAQVQQLTELLLSMALIQPLSLDITFADKSSTRLTGLYSIDQQKLAALDSAHIVLLHQQGLLAVVYTMLGSVSQIYGLIERKNQQLARL